eukprot:TRINITY_DN11318_c0_g1_i1.p1 TRINITY_DN11318_c0_g1~~TRINITY_DN11318_c0_g1_i1.p1  ORF type:complete len:562 (+),score=56.82 TRINITY_DN11318_c0_g1_i1:67-1752(+)
MSTAKRTAKAWVWLSVLVVVYMLISQLSKGDFDDMSYSGPIGTNPEIATKSDQKITEEDSPRCPAPSFPMPEEGSKEYLGKSGAWEGTCPNRNCNIGIRVLRPEDFPTDPAILSELEKPQQPVEEWTLPEEIEAEFSNTSRYEVPSDWKSDLVKHGKQWWTVSNFCVIDGRVTLFDPRLGVAKTADDPIRKKSKRFNLYNEFTRSRNKLRYNIESVPHKLPGPLVDNPGWILSFWCQDLFHSTLTLMPGFAIKKWNNSDIYVKLCRKSPCHVKFGSQHSWNDHRNPMHGGDKQFKQPGNPYWRNYRVITDKPWRIRPLYQNKHYNSRARCYREGMIDKKWFIQVTRDEAIKYSNQHLQNYGLTRTKRTCNKNGGYRATLINRIGASRRLSNIQEVAHAAVCHGFNVSIVAFENFDIRDQISIIMNTDLLIGMHGNGLIWTMFQEMGSYEIEIMGIWYERYAKLWGHGYNYTTTKDKHGHKGNEHVPFEADMNQITQALRNAKAHLDSTSCGKVKLPDKRVTHQEIWEDIVIRQHPELAKSRKTKPIAEESDSDSSATEGAT